MSISNYPRGSQWRKWDLHVHTPLSLKSGFGDDWDRYLDELESLPPDYKVLGINDYLFIDGYRRLVEEKRNNGRLQNIDLLLPVIEFRIAKFAGVEFRNTTRINLHVIFSDQLDADVIQGQFLNALQTSYSLAANTTGITWSGVTTKESLQALGAAIKANVPPDQLRFYGNDLVEGFNNLNANEVDIFKALENNTFLKGKYLTAVGKSEWENLDWNDGSIAEKKDIINRVHFVFTAAESAERARTSGTTLAGQHVNSRLLDCSDAHNFSDSTDKDRIGHCYTWIKADPTFEGLKQIVFEHDERVRLQDTNPIHDYPKTYFSKLKADGSIFNSERGELPKFSPTEVLLNPNLVALIGGRGAGKSLLLDVLCRTFSSQSDVEGRLEAIGEPKFEAVITRSDGSELQFALSDHPNSFEYLHVRQGDVKRVAVDPAKLATEIIELLGGLNEFLDPVFEEREQARIGDIVTTSKWLELEDEEGNWVNTPAHQNQRKTNAQELIDTLTTDETKDQIGTYTSNTTRVGKLTEVRQNLERLANRLKEFADEENVVIDAVNKEVATSGLNIDQVDVSTQQTQIEAIRTWAANEIVLIKAASAEIETQLRDKGIKGDLAGILGKIEDYQKIISDAEAKLEAIGTRQHQLATSWAELFQSVEILAERFEAERTSINTMFEEKLAGSPGALPEHRELIQRLLGQVSIEGQYYFDKDRFHSLLGQYLDGRKFRRRSIGTSFAINSEEQFLSLIRNEKVIHVGGDGDDPISLQEFAQSKDLFREGSNPSEFLELFFLEENRRKYLRVIPRILYHGKSPDQLSVGQRGTLYVCMKLATDLFTPFVFDQPEDDLDNEFIMDALRPIFQEIKQYRQVIIATHNANLVVNADAEQVIVAHNDSEVLSYTSGALEHTSGDYTDPGTRENVCRILEGGVEAFRQREKKYGMTE